LPLLLYPVEIVPLPFIKLSLGSSVLNCNGNYNRF
jgi:hypothetical protein